MSSSLEPTKAEAAEVTKLSTEDSIKSKPKAFKSGQHQPAFLKKTSFYPKLKKKDQSQGQKTSSTVKRATNLDKWVSQIVVCLVEVQ